MIKLSIQKLVIKLKKLKVKENNIIKRIYNKTKQIKICNRFF